MKNNNQQTEKNNMEETKMHEEEIVTIAFIPEEEGRHVIKRNGQEVDFSIEKPIACIQKANATVPAVKQLSEVQILAIAESVKNKVFAHKHATSVEEIQDWIELGLMEMRGYEVAQSYTHYRAAKAEKRKTNTIDDKVIALIGNQNEEDKQENANKDPEINSTQRDYIAGHVSKDLTFRTILPDFNSFKELSPKGKEIIKKGDGEKIVTANAEGLIHFHDADYFIQPMTNCCLINADDMLQNGTMISGVKIDKPRSFLTAANVLTQIIAQVASSQYGGQTFTLSHLAPFVDVSRKKLTKEVIAEREELGESLDEDIIKKIVERRLRKEIKQGIQTIQYQLITLMTTNGQSPFVTMFLYINEVPDGQIKDDLIMLIEEVFEQRIKGVKNSSGVYVSPTFPKLIYVLDEDNIEEGSKYYHVTELAAKTSAKRLVPDYISAKIMKEQRNGDVYPCMGCRSFLTVDDGTTNAGNKAKALNYEEGAHQYYGRFNQGVVTINLVDVACTSGGNLEEFWKVFDERLELCHKALRLRHERLLGTKSDVAPILWQHGAYARLERGGVIDPLLYGNYSTLSLGYAGLYECVFRMLEKSHTTEEGRELGLKIMQYMSDKCTAWKKDEDISYSLYGTPLESTTYKFAKALQKRFGIIPEVTDRNYITNSYHINVRENIDAFSKIEQESSFQHLSPGGSISYVEVPNMQNNISAVVAILQCIYDNITYAEINTKSDYCHVCHYEGEAVLVDNGSGKLVWECPNCKNQDARKMTVVRRVCGYLGEAARGMNQGRLGDIHDRVLHVSQRIDPMSKKTIS